MEEKSIEFGDEIKFEPSGCSDDDIIIENVVINPEDEIVINLEDNDVPAAEVPPVWEDKSTETPAETTPVETETPAPETESPSAEAETPATEPEAPAAPTVDLSKVEAMLSELNERFESKIANDTHKAELFDKMYAELQTYKNDIYGKMLKPFILSVATLIDDTNAFLGRLEENESRKAEKYLRGVPDDLVDILECNGVELYEDDTEVFNPRTQKATKTVPTDDPALDKHIAKRLRRGYRWNGSILRPESVSIYKFKG